MVAQDSAANGTDQPAAVAEVAALRVRQFFLERKLYRGTWTDIAAPIARIIVIRIYAAAACLVSMAVVARIGAFIRALSAHNWHVIHYADQAIVQAAFAQAGRYQGYLFPVLLVWAVFLLLTPPGYTFAFRAATVAAGILGFLDFTPSPFLVTAKVATMSHWLDQAGNWAIGPYFLASATLACVLYFHATKAFLHLGQPRERPGWLDFTSSPAGYLIRRLTAMPIVLLVLLSAIWATTVLRLAAAGGSNLGSAASYGYQAAFDQGRYLLVLALIAVTISQTTSNRGWLVAATILTVSYGLLPSTGPFYVGPTQYYLFPPTLEIPANLTLLTRMETAWGPDTLWAVLFIFVPVIILGIYLVSGLLRPPSDFPG